MKIIHNHNNFTAPKATNSKTFSHYLLEQYRYKKETLAMKEKELNSWRKLCTVNQKLEKLTTREILKMIEVKKNDYHHQVINRHLQTLEQYYYYLIEQKKRKDHPIKNFRIKQEKTPLIQTFLSTEELNKIYHNFPDKGHIRGQFDLFAKRNKVILGLVIYQALDAGTIGNLKVNDIDFEKAILSVPAKTIDLFYPRNLPLESVQILPLLDYVQNIRPAIVALLKLQSDYLFPYAQQERFKMVLLSIKRKIKTYYKLEDFKTLRHSTIAHWLKIYDIRIVQYKTGHKKLQSFDKYKKTQIESLQQAIEKYHVF